MTTKIIIVAAGRVTRYIGAREAAFSLIANCVSARGSARSSPVRRAVINPIVHRHLEAWTPNGRPRTRFQPQGSEWQDLDAPVRARAEGRDAGLLPFGGMVTVL